MLKNLMFSFIFLTTSYCINSSVVTVDNNTITKVEQKKKSGNSDPQELLKLVNQLRKKGCRCGRKRMKSAPRLKLNNLLSQAALAHAKDMAAKNFFDHKGSNGSDISQRISKTGYDWQAVGENIFWGQVGIQEVFQGWKDSPSHCKNMMSQDFREMGFAKVGNYWVQDLGKQF